MTRTMLLDADKSWTENLDDANAFFYPHGGRDLTGLFAFEDRQPYMLHFPQWQRSQLPIMPHKMIKAVERWSNKGKGYALLHSKSYPRRCSPRGERIPVKLTDTKFFYHLGGFGASNLWNEVTSARARREPSNMAVYNMWYDLQRRGAEFPEYWNNAHRLDGGSDHVVRSYTSFVWNDGEIEKFNSYEDGSEQDSRLRYRVFMVDRREEDSIRHTPVFLDQPEWSGED